MSVRFDQTLWNARRTPVITYLHPETVSTETAYGRTAAFPFSVKVF